MDVNRRGYQSSETIQEEISLFEDKIKSCEGSYGSSELEFWLGYLKSSPSLRKNGGFLCLGHLRDLIAKHRELNAKDVSRPPEKLFRYFDWFFRFLHYMGELKLVFVQQILSPLQNYFLDDTGSLSGYSLRTNAPSSASSQGTTSTSRSSWDYFEKNHASKKLTEKEYRDLKLLYDDQALAKVKAELESTVSYWGAYLEEDTVFDIDLLDKNAASPQKGTGIGQDVIYLINLLPNILVHCTRAASLAKDWIKLYSEQSLSLEARLDKLHQVQRTLSQELSGVSTEIAEKERLLEKQSDDLQRLLQREERSNEINAKLYEMEQILQSLDNNLLRAESERDSLTSDIKRASSNSSSDLRILKLKFEENKLKRHLLSREIKARQYSRSLLQKDLDLEMEIKPMFVRYTNDMQEKCQALEETINEKREDQTNLRSLIGPLEEDKQQIQRDIMGLSSLSLNSTYQNEASDLDLSARSQDVNSKDKYAKHLSSERSVPNNRRTQFDPGRYEDRDALNKPGINT